MHEGGEPRDDETWAAREPPAIDTRLGKRSLTRMLGPNKLGEIMGLTSKRGPAANLSSRIKTSNCLVILNMLCNDDRWKPQTDFIRIFHGVSSPSIQDTVLLIE